MDNDDLPVGRVLSRREVLRLLGGSTLLLAGYGAAHAASQAQVQAQVSERSDTLTKANAPFQAQYEPAKSNTCVVRPELTEGPYFVDEALNRSDIRTDSTSRKLCLGVPLGLNFNVSDVSDGACRPLPNAYVDVWHCDARGLYSDVAQDGTDGQDFLRGLQKTNTNGIARFTTVYPGWYRGRAVHIHFKIRGTKAGRAYEFTSQLFFPDALSDQIFANAPYAQNGLSQIPNTRDGIFRAGGQQLLLTPTRTQPGLVSTLHIGLQI